MLLRHSFRSSAGKCVMVSVYIMDCFIDLLMWHRQQGMACAPASTPASQGPAVATVMKTCMWESIALLSCLQGHTACQRSRTWLADCWLRLCGRACSRLPMFPTACGTALACQQCKALILSMVLHQPLCAGYLMPF